MLCLLTSNDKPRYLLDALRVVALPQGAAFQFRYRTKHVPKNLRDDAVLPSGKRKILKDGSYALVVAVEQAPAVAGATTPVGVGGQTQTETESRTIKFYSLRFVKLYRTDLSGGLLRIDFLADSYCKDMSLHEPGSTDSTGAFKWPYVDGAIPKGDYIFADNRVTMDDNKRIGDDESPLPVIQQVLGTWPGYKDYPLFQVSAPKKSGKSPVRATSAGSFDLTEHTHYAVDVTHLYSRESKALLTLGIAPSGDHGLVVEQHTLDTELNVHRFKFATRRVGPVALCLQLSGDDFDQNPPFSVTIEGNVQRGVLRRLGYGAVAGGIAALPGLSTAAMEHFGKNPDSSLVCTLLAIAAATFLMGPLAAMFARD